MGGGGGGRVGQPVGGGVPPQPWWCRHDSIRLPDFVALGRKRQSDESGRTLDCFHALILRHTVGPNARKKGVSLCSNAAGHKTRLPVLNDHATGGLGRIMPTWLHYTTLLQNQHRPKLNSLLKTVHWKIRETIHTCLSGKAKQGLSCFFLFCFFFRNTGNVFVVCCGQQKPEYWSTTESKTRNQFNRQNGNVQPEMTFLHC